MWTFFFLVLYWTYTTTTEASPTTQDASYNSMTRQIGYCRMQSFDTRSRSTSGSVPMFLDGRIAFGVGFPSRDAEAMEAFSCGMCLNVTHVENFYSWNPEITEWGKPWDSSSWFLVMVFDECKDPVCQQPFYLDFDIYSETQPVARGNPYGVQWHIVPCPLAVGETLEYLFCTANSCHEQDPIRTTPLTMEPYWSLTIRNFRFPLVQVWVLYQGEWKALRRENAWVWDQGSFDMSRSLRLKLQNSQEEEITDIVSMANGFSDPSYRGAWRISSDKSM